LRKSIAWIILLCLLPSVVLLAQDEEPVDVPPVEETPEAQPFVPPSSDANTILVNVRLDLETLASQLLGTTRPTGWTGAGVGSDSELALGLRTDLELLAFEVSGTDRPEGWFGVVPSSTFAVARDVRHDLELLVDETGVVRPANWIGGEPLFRCDRATQALVRYLEEAVSFTLQADRTAANFCEVAQVEASTFAEVAIGGTLGGGAAQTAAGAAGDGGDPRIVADDAVGYIDAAGTVPAATFPVGEPLELVARAPGTSLMLVRGFRFELFVDYTKTSVPADVFESLLNVGGFRVVPRCDADWCG